MADPVSAVISAIGSGLTSVIEGISNRNFALEQQKAGWSEEQRRWNQQNEYNAPVNQMKRLEQANLNPALIYGGGANSLAGNFAHVNTAQAPINTDLAQIAQINNLEAQNAQIVAATKLTETQREIQDRILKQQKWIEDKTGYPAATGDPLPITVIDRAVAAGKDTADKNKVTIESLQKEIKDYDSNKYRRNYYDRHKKD